MRHGHSGSQSRDMRWITYAPALKQAGNGQSSQPCYGHPCFTGSISTMEASLPVTQMMKND